jgi:tubulin-specific chaperone E
MLSPSSSNIDSVAGTGDDTSIFPSVGTRFALSGYIGTIRYVGEVGGTCGIWLGVEWDDPSRGKHDGIKDGKHYFSCL